MSKWFDEEEDDAEEEIPEKSETLEENWKLEELGIALDLADQFRSYQKNKNVFYGGKLTKQFMDWILKSCNKDQLWLIKEHYDKYAPEFQEMIKKAKPHNLGQEAPTWNEDWIEVHSEIGTLKQYIRFLYDLLGRMNEKASHPFNDVEIEMIEKIDEVLKR